MPGLKDRITVWYLTGLSCLPLETGGQSEEHLHDGSAEGVQTSMYSVRHCRQSRVRRILAPAGYL